MAVTWSRLVLDVGASDPARFRAYVERSRVGMAATSLRRDEGYAFSERTGVVAAANAAIAMNRRLGFVDGQSPASG